MVGFVAVLPSKGLHRGVEHVAHTPLRPDEFGRAGIDLQLAAQAQDLHVVVGAGIQPMQPITPVDARSA
jgi:hypothetical protein